MTIQSDTEAASAHEPESVLLRRVIAAGLDGIIGLALPVSYLANQLVLRELATDADAARRCNFVNDLTADHCLHAGTYVLTGTTAMIGTALALWAAAIVIHHGLLSGLTGWTFGKLTTGLRVVHVQRRTRAGLLANLTRTVLLTVDALPYVIPLIGPAMISVSRRHQRLGDLVARTRVVRTKDKLGTRSKGHADLTDSPPAGGTEESRRGTTNPPGIDAPLWDPERNTYIQWDPERDEWMQWSTEYDLWLPITR